jgi:hypothetical protein
MNQPVNEQDVTTFSTIMEYALKVITVDELHALQEQPRSMFFSMLNRRLMQPGPAPTVAEVEGLREMATEVLWHPALGRVAP